MAIRDVLGRHMKAAGTGETLKAWAEKLGEDSPTLNKIVRGKIALTEKRTTRWIERIYPEDQVAQQIMRDELARSAGLDSQSVAELCDSIVAAGGIIPAARIGEVFAALGRHDVVDPLVCVEYRDSPRASPDAKYPELGAALAKAIVGGMNFAMFLPFGEGIPEPPPHGTEPVPGSENAGCVPLRTARAMQTITEETRGAYLAFRQQVLEALIEDGDVDPAIAKETAKNRLRAYEAKGCGGCISGFGSKIFYIQWRDTNLTMHHRIFEWSSTPTQDWLLYRGEIDIDPVALRDSFYPVPHFFDILQENGDERQRRLPTIMDFDEDGGADKYRRLWAKTPGFRHPVPGGWKLSSVCRDQNPGIGLEP